MVQELESAALREPLALAQKVASSPGTPALISGERGSPMEDLARFIHDHSGSRVGQFVVVRCAGVAEPMLEAELFGDAPSGAQSSPAAQRALSGTLFIDSIAELGAAAQARLIAMLEEQSLQPAARGMRVIAGTTSDLREAVRARAFRADLMDLLSVVTIRLPPLRTRLDDVERLALSFAREVSHQLGKRIERISAAAMAKLRAYSFPGNERELRSIIDRAVIFESGATVTAEAVELPGESLASTEAFTSGLAAPIAEEHGRPATLAEIERAYIVWMLRQTHGNRTAASRMLGISYPTIAKKIADYGIDLRSFRPAANEPTKPAR